MAYTDDSNEKSMIETKCIHSDTTSPRVDVSEKVKIKVKQQLHLFSSLSPWVAQNTAAQLSCVLKSQLNTYKVHLVIFIHVLLVLFIAMVIALLFMLHMIFNLVDKVSQKYIFPERMRVWCVQRVSMFLASQEKCKKPPSNEATIITVIINAVSRDEAINSVSSFLQVKVRETVSYSQVAREPFIHCHYLPRYLSFFVNCQQKDEQEGEIIAEVIKISTNTSKSVPISGVSSYLVAVKCLSSERQIRERVQQLGYMVTQGRWTSQDNQEDSECNKLRNMCRKLHVDDKCIGIDAQTGDLSKWPPEVPLFTSPEGRNTTYTGFHADTVVKVFSWLKGLFTLVQAAHSTVTTLAKQLIQHLNVNRNARPRLLQNILTGSSGHLERARVTYTSIASSPCKSLTLASVDCIPCDLMSLIRCTSKWTDDEIAIALIAGGIKSYIQVVTGETAGNIEAYLESPGETHLTLALDSADDLLMTGEVICQQLRSSSPSIKYKRMNILSNLPNFLSNYVDKMCKCNNEVVIRSCRVNNHSNQFICRSLCTWSPMSSDNCLSFNIIHSNDGSVICISARRDVIQSASLLAECIAKSLLNLCISLSISYDRRTPPSSPQDTTDTGDIIS